MRRHAATDRNRCRGLPRYLERRFSVAVAARGWQGKRMRSVFSAGFAALLSVTALFAQRGNPALAYEGETVDAMIADFMRDHEVPGLVLAIVQAPYITRTSGYGIADPERRLLASSHTVFRLGQMAEAYTAVAIMQLVEKGRVQLDDPIGQHLAGLPEAWRGVTLRQVLHHQSGLPDYTREGREALAKAKAPAELLAAVAGKGLEFEPGTRFAPSATDHLVLQWLVERATGETYEAFVRREQFERLGLKQTFFVGDLESPGQERPGSGGKHRRFLEDPKLINPIEPAAGRGEPLNPRLLPERAAIYASAADVSFWDIGLAGSVLIKDPALRRVLYQPAKLKTGAPVASSGAWAFPGHPGLMVVTGSEAGFSSLLSRFTDPKELVCVTLLANKEGLDLTQLARRIAGAYDPAIGAPAATARQRVQQSPHSVPETITRLERALRAEKITILARVDHAQGAAAVGQKLPATEEIIFGHPAAGTPLMQTNPAVAVDLPLRATAWEADGEVWLAATDPVEIVRQHAMAAQRAHALKMRATVDRALREAVAP
jgi:D-alanyl-D-alanine carboxypeptidase